MKPILGHEGHYCITDDGRVWREPRLVPGKARGGVDTIRQFKGMWLRPLANNRGYLKVGLWKGGLLRQHYIHRLVASAFLPCPNETVDHIDNDKTNNHVSNLQWMSRLANYEKEHN